MYVVLISIEQSIHHTSLRPNYFLICPITTCNKLRYRLPALFLFFLTTFGPIKNYNQRLPLRMSMQSQLSKGNPIISITVLCSLFFVWFFFFGLFYFLYPKRNVDEKDIMLNHMLCLINCSAIVGFHYLKASTIQNIFL